MKMQEIIEIAKRWGIPFKVGLSKADLIWSIQKKEGYTACFRRDDGCKGHECLWKDDCIPGK
jgi:hypothetical protein